MYSYEWDDSTLSFRMFHAYPSNCAERNKYKTDKKKGKKKKKKKKNE